MCTCLGAAMLPNNALSTIPLPSSFLHKVRRWSVPTVDFEQGGRALQDSSAGLSVQTWQLQYDAGSGNFDVVSADGVRTTAFTKVGARSVGLAFDQSMNPVLCWDDVDGAHIRWLNQALGEYTITSVAGASHPCASLDERDPNFLSVSDVIFAYTRADGALCYRQQRDLYATERVLSLTPGGVLTAVGTNTGLRFQFRLKPT